MDGWPGRPSSGVSFQLARRGRKMPLPTATFMRPSRRCGSKMLPPLWECRKLCFSLTLALSPPGTRGSAPAAKGSGAKPACFPAGNAGILPACWAAGHLARPVSRRRKGRSLTAGIFRRNGGDELRRDIDGWDTGDGWWCSASRLAQPPASEARAERRVRAPLAVNAVNQVNTVTSRDWLERLVHQGSVMDGSKGCPIKWGELPARPAWSGNTGFDGRFHLLVSVALREQDAPATLVEPLSWVYPEGQALGLGRQRLFRRLAHHRQECLWYLVWPPMRQPSELTRGSGPWAG